MANNSTHIRRTFSGALMKLELLERAHREMPVALLVEAGGAMKSCATEEQEG